MMSCKDNSSCDDCSRIALNRIQFTIENSQGQDLFFQPGYLSPNDLEIFYLNSEEELEHVPELRWTDDYFFTYLPTNLSSEFYFSFNDQMDTLRITSNQLISSCANCPKFKLETLSYNGNLICDICENEQTFVSNN